MAIEQIMFFALGFLLASLFAIIILPSVWKRAVRLTKKRIESATPITMAEFRADKDQMRAEFALSTRRLERNIETLRNRLTEQLSELNSAKSDLAIAVAESNRHIQLTTELEERNHAANNKIVDLEKQLADLSHQLRSRNRDLEDLSALVNTDDKPIVGSAKSAVSSIRSALNFGDKKTFDALEGIDEAYSRISSAGSDLSALLDGDKPANDTANNGVAKPADQSLAAELRQEDALEKLHEQITQVEDIINKDWDSGNVDKGNLRDRLGDIASSVSKAVYAADTEASADQEESLFDRIRKFASDGMDISDLPKTPRKQNPTLQPTSGTAVSDRISAFRDIHANS